MAKKTSARKNTKAQADAPPPEAPRFLNIYNLKSAFFRVIHADGIWGHLNAHGNVHICFYSERSALPQVAVYPITDSGNLGPECVEKRVIRDGPVRELESDVV